MGTNDPRAWRQRQKEKVAQLEKRVVNPDSAGLQHRIAELEAQLVHERSLRKPPERRGRGKGLTVQIFHDKTCVQFLDGPGLRKVAVRHSVL